MHPVLGDIDGLKVLKYMAPEFIAETRNQNVSKAVHVQAAIGIADPVEETRWLQEQADATGFPHGIVAHCNLTARDVEPCSSVTCSTRTCVGSATSAKATT